MKRYRIATLLLITAIVAISFAALRPFRPELTVFDIVDLDKRHSYNSDAKYYELTVANSGDSDIWLPDNSAPYSDATFNYDPGTEDFTFVNILGDEREWVRLAPGDGLSYDLYVTSRFRNIEVGLDVRDWRGRETFYETQLRFVRDSQDGG